MNKAERKLQIKIDNQKFSLMADALDELNWKTYFPDVGFDWEAVGARFSLNMTDEFDIVDTENEIVTQGSYSWGKDCVDFEATCYFKIAFDCEWIYPEITGEDSALKMPTSVNLINLQVTAMSAEEAEEYWDTEYEDLEDAEDSYYDEDSDEEDDSDEESE